LNISKYFIIFCLIFLIGACTLEKGSLYVDIGDYEAHLAAWNSQNLLDYQIEAVRWYGPPIRAIITIKDGILESINNTYWLEYGLETSIPDFYSFIKEAEKRIKNEHNYRDKRALSLNVSYNTMYHYPSSITEKADGIQIHNYTISLMPLEKGDLDIDIGDYENQLSMWDNQNMLDYQIMVWHRYGRNNHNSITIGAEFKIENGIPNINDPGFEFKKTTSIPSIFAFVKEEEERIRNAYNGVNRSFLHVEYDTEYHFPKKIHSGVAQHFGSYYIWEISLTPLEAVP